MSAIQLYPRRDQPIALRLLLNLPLQLPDRLGLVHVEKLLVRLKRCGCVATSCRTVIACAPVAGLRGQRGARRSRLTLCTVPPLITSTQLSLRFLPLPPLPCPLYPSDPADGGLG